MFTYAPGFISNPTDWFGSLWTELDWERRDSAPRREYWATLLGRSYTYGRGLGIRTYEPRPTHRLIDLGRDLIEEHSGVTLEGCFLNGYEGARDHLGWHADDDPGIDHTKPIAIITVGQGRAIQFREVLDAAERQYGEIETVMLEPGSLCLMHAGAQHTHQHRIPKVDRAIDPRVSLTYRGLIA
jgi:alkylated DNA repair dioxygenase AlkB